MKSKKNIFSISFNDTKNKLEIAPVPMNKRGKEKLTEDELLRIMNVR